MLNVDNNMFDILDKLDANHDGVLSASEIKAATPDQMSALKQHADTNSEWEVIRSLANVRGNYKDMQQNVEKSMEPGGGGRSSLLKDQLISVNGYEEELASKIVGSIARKMKGVSW